MNQRTLGLLMAAVALAAVLLYGHYALQNPKQAGAQGPEISVAWDGTIMLDGKPVTCEELHARLREMDPAPDPADAKEQDAKLCAESRRRVDKELVRNVREENGVAIVDHEGGTILNFKSGDRASVDRSGKARWNGKRVSCQEARERALTTINVRPFPDEKLAKLLPCK